MAFCPAFKPGTDLSGMVNPHTAALERAAANESARIAAAGLLTIGIMICFLFVFMYDDGDDMPPRAPISVTEAVRGMASPDAPEFLCELSRRVGPVFRLPMPMVQRYYVVTDLELARAILSDSGSTKPLQACADALLLTAGVCSLLSMRDSPESCPWSRSRECVAPAFGASELRHRVLPVSTRHAHALVTEVLEPAARSGEEVDVCVHAQRLALGVVCEAGFGYAPTAAECTAFARDVRLAHKEAARRRLLNPLRRLLPCSASEQGRAAAAAAERCLAFGLRLLARHRQLGKAEQEQVHGSLVALIDASTAYADDRARAAEIVALLLSAQASTADQLSWCLADLARHTEEQRALRAALCAAREPLAAPELASVIQESLRLHCAVAGGSLRFTGKAFACPPRSKAGAHDGASGDSRPAAQRTIPAGSIVQLHAYSIMRDSRVFERAEEFVPSRWHAAREGRPEGAPGDPVLPEPLPFSLGRRACPGQGLALLVLSVAVAALVGQFELELAQHPKAAFCATSTPVGLAVRVRRAQPIER